MNQQHIGWITVLAAFGALLGLLALEISGLKTFSEAATPLFVGKSLGHIATVIAAFVGGKYLPQPGA